MAVVDMTEADLIDFAEHALSQMRNTDPLERIFGLSAFQMFYNEIMDRHRATGNYAEVAPLTGLAEVIAGAMWDANGNRIGGPRTAADAVLAAGWKKVMDDPLAPVSRRVPPMWGIWLIDPSGKYGAASGKVFHEHGETAADAERSALARYRVRGVVIDPERSTYLSAAATDRPERTVVDGIAQAGR
jgi:hypothetical protein